MPILINMPSLSPTMKEGKLSKWLKNKGDKIMSGDVIAEIETDKATMEIESSDDGVLFEIIIQEGEENVPVNSPIAIIKEEGDTDEQIHTFSKTSGIQYHEGPISNVKSLELNCLALPPNLEFFSKT